MKSFHPLLLAGALGWPILLVAADPSSTDTPASSPQGPCSGYEGYFPAGYTAPRMSTGNGAVAIVSPTPFFRAQGFGSTSPGITRVQTGGSGGTLVQPSRRQDGNTELMQAAVTGDIARVRQLLDRNVNVNAHNRFGSTALMGAAAGGHLQIVKLLLEHLADPNAKGRDGSTALIFAARNGHAETVAALLRGGADPSLEDSAGKTAVTHALEQGYIELAQTIKTSPQPLTRP
jgi:hypothetical protein